MLKFIRFFFPWFFHFWFVPALQTCTSHHSAPFYFKFNLNLSFLLFFGYKEKKTQHLHSLLFLHKFDFLGTTCIKIYEKFTKFSENLPHNKPFERLQNTANVQNILVKIQVLASKEHPPHRFPLYLKFFRRVPSSTHYHCWDSTRPIQRVIKTDKPLLSRTGRRMFCMLRKTF